MHKFKNITFKKGMQQYAPGIECGIGKINVKWN
jgi:hypothetical protein